VLLEHWLIDRKPSSGVHERNVDKLENRPLSITESEPGEQPETGTTLGLDRPMAIDLLCRMCGERGGEWQRLREFTSGDGVILECNRRAAVAADESGKYIYEHLCRPDSIDIDMPGVGVVSARGDGSPVSCAPGGEGAAGQESPRHPAGGVDQDLNAKEAATGERLAAGDAIRPLEFADVVSGAQFTELIGQLAEVVRKAHPTSALIALKVTACAFGALLDIYAAPNAENPEGMCDDLDAFRNVFAQIIAGGAL